MKQRALDALIPPAIARRAFTASLVTAAALAAGPAAAGALAAEPPGFVAGADGLTPFAPAGAAIDFGTAPNAVAITPDGKTAFVTDAAADSVTRINLETRTVAATIDKTVTTTGQPGVMSNPVAVAITPDGKRAYVGRTGDGESSLPRGGVEWIDVNDVDTTVATSVDGAANPVRGIAITPDGKSAYFTNGPGLSTTQSDPGYVASFDIARNRVVGSEIELGMDTTPRGIAITPDGKLALVVNLEADNVTRINLATRTAVGNPIPVGNEPREIAITPDGTTAYVTNSASDNVTAINLLTLATRPIPVGDNPHGIAITPSGRTAYVANTGAGTLTPIDTAANTPGTAFAAGTNPSGIAITPDQAPVTTLTASGAALGATTTFDAPTSVKYGTIASYAWDFGDGTGATTTTPTATHVYTRPGSYAARVTATSSNGTSTAFVFTGQTALRNGGASATSALALTIPANAAPSPTSPGGSATIAPRETCAGKASTIRGTTGNDRLVGTEGDDVIVALGGNDTIDGRGGNDVICGGDGTDTVRGGGGDDRLLGGSGNDTLAGGAGKDRVRGDAGADRVKGGKDDDRLEGNGGDDAIAGGSGDDRIEGDKHDDRLTGGAGDDALYGNHGDDVLQGGPGHDRLRGGPGTNRLEPGPEPGSSRR